MAQSKGEWKQRDIRMDQKKGEAALIVEKEELSNGDWLNFRSKK